MKENNILETNYGKKIKAIIDFYNQEGKRATNDNLIAEVANEILKSAEKELFRTKSLDADLCCEGCFIPLISIKEKSKVKGITFGDKIRVIIKKYK